MELNEILKGLKTKATESKKMTGLNSRHFAFKNWHATVMQLLRELPSSYLPIVNEFKALAFEDTGYKRGRKFLSSPDNSRFLQDLSASGKILNEIINTAKKEEKKKEPEAAPSKPKKPSRTASGKSTGKKPVKKAGSRKASGTKGAKKPASSGSSSTRKSKKT